ncbi:stomatin 1 [Paramuricea clavata]|uniref:Stomatin 1 n=1 Tax=Paramuricea clavata TaxID=317549 RepID=A0A6S7IKD7_PARCT|nr:stomatin 1 [Paramuricea clavata]
MATKYSFLGRQDRLGLYSNDSLHTERISANKTVDVIGWIITFIAYVFAILTLPVSVFCCVKIIQDYERAVIFRLGRLQPVKQPGVIFILPCIDKWDRVDMRVKAFNVPPQKILTKDQAAVLVGATVQFLIKDPVASKGVVQDLNHSMRVLAQTTLVNIMMTLKLVEIQNDKKFTSIHAQDELNKATKSWGVQIHRIEISEPQVICAPPEFKPDLASMFKGADNPISTLFQVMQGATSGITPQVLPSRSNPATHHAPAMPVSREQPPHPTPLDPDQLVAIFNHVTDERLVQEIGCVYQFNISGQGGVWYLDLKNGCGRGGKGPPLGCMPDAVISLSSEDMHALFAGEMTAFNAYMQGRVTVEGDVRMAMKLESVVERMKQPRMGMRTAHVQNDHGRNDVMII